VSEIVIYGLVGLIVLLTHLQAAITGFGGTVLALPFVTLLLGLHVAVPVLVIQAWILALLIVLQSRKSIPWMEWGHIVLLVGIGLPLGFWMSQSMPEAGLKWVLAVFAVGVGVHGLVTRSKDSGIEHKISTRARWFTSGLLPLGGIIHGAFGSGGPLVVVYATRALADKGQFRAALCLLWVVLNTALIGGWVVSSSLDAHILGVAAFCLSFTLLGLILGNAAHYRVNEVVFRQIVYAVLIVAGLALTWPLIG